MLIGWMTCSRRYWWIYSLKYFSNGGYFTKNGRRLCKWRSKVFGSSSLRLTIALSRKLNNFFSLFPRTSYLLNFVEYCLSYVSYKADVWRLEKHYGWLCWWLSLRHCQKSSRYISNLLFTVRKKKGFKVTFVKEHNWAKENLEVLWLSFDNMLILVCEGGDEAGS